MVTLSGVDDGGVRTLRLFDTAIVSGLLVVTNFLAGSALRTGGFACAGFAAAGFLWAIGFAVAGFFAGTGLAGLTGFFAAFTAAAFLAGDLAAALRAAVFAAVFGAIFLAAGFDGFFATPALAWVAALREPFVAGRTAALARVGAFAAFARLTAICLLFAIPKPIL